VDLRAAEILTGSDCARAGAVVRLPRMPGYSSRLTQEPTRTRSAFEPGSERAGLGIRLVSMLLKLTPSVVGAAGVTQPSPICSRSRSSRSSNPTASPAADRARLRRARHALRGRGHFRSPIAHARDPAATDELPSGVHLFGSLQSTGHHIDIGALNRELPRSVGRITPPGSARSSPA
jgi:hypothetical protein